MNNKLVLKDYLLIALLTALYLVFYFAAMMIASAGGPFVHNISPGLAAVPGGLILYFMSANIGKFGQFTLLTLIIMALFTLMGGGYLPWLITSVLAALIADALASRGKNPSFLKLASASAVLHIGQACGSILPVLLFVDRFKEEWVRRGQSAAEMDALIHYASGIWALVCLCLVAGLSVFGIFLAHLILKKHLRRHS